MKPGKPLLPTTEYQGDYMILEVIGRILPLLQQVVYYEGWAPFPIMETTENIIYAATDKSRFAQNHRLEVIIVIANIHFYSFKIDRFKKLLSDLLHISIRMIREETFRFVLIVVQGALAFPATINTQVEKASWL